MSLLTIEKLEEAVGAELFGLSWRLLRDFRNNGNRLRTEFVRDRAKLEVLAYDLETVAGDCRLLLGRKEEAAGDGMDAAAGAGLAGGDGAAGGHGRPVAQAG